jgi:hypothetical protein
MSNNNGPFYPESWFAIVLLCIIISVIGVIILFLNRAPTKISDIEITTIDGCEYIVNTGYPIAKILTHKGNCTNSIHIYNKPKIEKD